MKKLSTTIVVCVLFVVLYLVLGTIWVQTVKPLWSDFIMERYANSDRSNRAVAIFSNIYGVGAALITQVPLVLLTIAEIKLWKSYVKKKNNTDNV